MNSFYEKERENSNQLSVYRNEDATYPSHFHNTLEIFLIKSGKYEITVNDKSYIAADGTIVIIDSYDVHSYTRVCADNNEETRLLLIPYRMLDRFNSRKKGFSFADNLINDYKLCLDLIDQTDRFLLSECDEYIKEASVDLCLFMLFPYLSFLPEKRHNEVTLIRNILSYIHENYREDISRKTIARALGYTGTYISHVFHQYINKSLSDYINFLRLDYFTRRQKEGYSGTTLALLFEAGFNSQQSYYRARKKYKNA